MRYNVVGRTSLKVSEISFGAGTGAGLMVNGEIAEQTSAVEAAIDAGINHFDTAAFYGFGASEVYLGQALRAARATDVLVTSKVAIGREYLETRALRRAVRQSVEQSLSRLRRETLDILLIHNATHATHAPYDPERESERVAGIMNSYIPAVTPEDLLGQGGILEEVDRLIEAGKVRHFGLSGQDNEPAVVRSMIQSGKIAIFNQTFNLLNPSAGFAEARAHQKVSKTFAEPQRELFIDFDDVIESARTAAVGVSVISALAAGVLTDAADRGESPLGVSRRTNRFPFPGEFDRQLAIARRFKPVAQQAGMSLSELAVRFVLSTPGVTTLVGGLSSRAQVEEMASYAGKSSLPPEILRSLRAIWLDAA